jgi:hypothetical protein
VAHGPPLGASITWLTTYDRNPACGHPTDGASLRRLAASGWQLSGPGWPPGQLAVLGDLLPIAELAELRGEAGACPG